MRLCTPASLCLAAAAALLPAASDAHAAPRPPACVAADQRAFPLTTRLHGGPASYTAGGGFGVWYIELTNTTGRPCTRIHPVVVLVDTERALRPSQPRLEFFEGNRPHAVRFERTDRDELVGVLADERGGFPGFSVGPRRTLTVKVRLAVTSDAVPNDVTAQAAVVQRHDDDGAWVGESNAYRFRIEGEPGPAAGRSSSATVPEADAPSATPPATRLPLADELARTGVSGPALATAGALLLAAGGAVLLARRRR
ncbi:LPXTG cell wall anchor domain-containing protein [Streptomyces bullii]|uniref:LPXTG cell wall anchor domain-containing protein n=1 Tax=Streptomyces bullii TaxID=349910 RepID=A0ABW0UGX2_9ACTN